MDDVQSVKSLGDYVHLQRGNTYKSALLGEEGPVLLGLASIARNGGFRSDNLKTYGGTSDKRMLLQPGDIYVSLKDVTQSADLLGAVARVPDTISQGRLTQDTVKLIFKDEDAPKTYIYWLLRTPQYRAYCKAHATGTTNLGLPRGDFLAFPIPALTPSRRGLLELLQALDDKIELNRRMNKTLESMARAIFKDWFVDFGPIRAKMEGRAPYLAPEIWDLFPDAIDDDKPRGWRSGTLHDLIVLQRGFDLPKSKRVEGKYPVLAASGINGTHDQAKVPGPGVATGRSGVIGNVFYIHDNFWPLNTSLWVKEYKNSSPPHAYFLIQTLDFRSFNSGSAVPTLNRNHVHNLPIRVPPPEVVSAFDKLVEPLLQRQRINDIECGTLAQTRDLLLPKLMSGEIRLRGTEKAVEAVA